MIGSLIVFSLAFILRFPWVLASRLFVPLGLPRLSHGWLRVTTDEGLKRDPAGSALVGGAWALGRRRDLDEEAAAFLDAELAKLEPLRGAGVFAAGLLLAARGDLDGARRLIESVHRLDERVRPPVVDRLANAWLAADAAARGEWLRAAELGLGVGQGGRQAWLLSGVAQCRLLEPMAPGHLGLWLRWALAPNRRATLPIVRRALAALDGAFISPGDVEPKPRVVETDASDPLSTALLLHAALLAAGARPVTADEVRTLGHAWDAALGDSSTERRLAERALSIGASGASAALGRLRASVEEDIAAVVLSAGMPLSALGERGKVTDRVRAKVRDRLLSEVEVASDSIRRRCDDKRALPAIDEWREWIALTALVERGTKLAGDDFRRLAFYKVHPDACSLAVWLFNDRNQRPIGNAMFRWLLAEAEAVGDARSVTLQQKNVGCGI
ncbi:MAG: hypothetical protein U0359_04650 [Byssovorax sp.]